MAKEKKLSVRTPPNVYMGLIQRAFQLDMSHREYCLGLIMQDLERAEKGQGLTEAEANELKNRIKKLDKL